jgi:hypothetical protein
MTMISSKISQPFSWILPHHPKVSHYRSWNPADLFMGAPALGVCGVLVGTGVAVVLDSGEKLW